MSKAVFYHAGCPVCVDAEQTLLQFLDHAKIEPEIVHLGSEVNRIEEAEKFGVESVPALVIDEQVYHINFGASIEEVKSG